MRQLRDIEELLLTEINRSINEIMYDYRTSESSSDIMGVHNIRVVAGWVEVASNL